MEHIRQTFSGTGTSAEVKKLHMLLHLVYDALEANNNVVAYTLHFHESPSRETMLRAQEQYLDAQLTRQQAGIFLEAEKGELKLDFTVIGPRLKQYREEAQIAEELAAQALGSTPTRLEAIEAGTIAIGGHELFLLADLYSRQVFEILQGPLLYQTPDEILAAWDRGAISEGVASYALGVSIVEARAKLHAFQKEVKRSEYEIVPKNKAFLDI